MTHKYPKLKKSITQLGRNGMMGTAPSRHRMPLAGRSIGRDYLWQGYSFDFESGIVAADRATADVWWEWISDIPDRAPFYRYLRPVNGAALYLIASEMATADFDRLSLSDLQGLPYSTVSLGPTSSLRQGAVFAVRTRHIETDITLAKVQIDSYGAIEGTEYDLYVVIRWATYSRPIHFLDVKVTLGSTPEWLVTRYVVQCTYNTPTDIRICGTGTFGAQGGIVQGQISDETGAFPSSIVITVTLDFEPDTNLTALVKTFTAAVTNTGVNFIFEPYQVLQKTDILLDLQPLPKATDYLLLRWAHHNTDGSIVASGQKHLSGNELREQTVTQYQIIFKPDPIIPKDLNIQIEGRFQGKVLPTFSQTYDLADKAVLIRAKKSDSRYTLVSI